MTVLELRNIAKSFLDVIPNKFRYSSKVIFKYGERELIVDKVQYDEDKPNIIFTFTVE